MLSQIEAPQTSAAVVNTETDTTPTAVDITAVIFLGAIFLSIPNPNPVSGLSAGGDSVTVPPGIYAITFTLVGDFFNGTSGGITAQPTGNPNVTVTPVELNTSTTGTIIVTNGLSSDSQPVPVSVTFNMEMTGPQDPTIVNDPPQG